MDGKNPRTKMLESWSLRYLFYKVSYLPSFTRDFFLIFSIYKQLRLRKLPYITIQ